MLKNIRKLESLVEDNNKIKINEILFSLCEQMSEISKANAVAHIRGEKRKEIKDEYKATVIKIKELNEIAKETSVKKIYEGDFSKESIQDFVLKLSNEMFGNRNIRRR